MAAAAPSISRSILTVVVLCTPCLASAVFAMRDVAAPALTASDDRPALVFGTYMIPASATPASDDPVIEQEFEFLNKGKHAVSITDLVPSCGCLSPTISSRDIAPGEFGRVVLPVKTTNETAGFHEYLVKVRYTDPKPREVNLTFKVNLPEKKIIIQPRVLMVMGRISGEQRYPITITDHRSRDQKPAMKITDVISSSSFFNAELAGQSATDGAQSFSLSVRFSEPIPAGQHKGVIVVATDDPHFPVLQIPVVAGDPKRPADEPVSIDPAAAMVILNADSPQDSTGTTVSFDIPSKWKFSHFDTFPQQLQTEVLPIESVAADLVRVTARISVTSLPLRGIERGVLTLHADDGSDLEMVSVPISLSWQQ